MFQCICAETLSNLQDAQNQMFTYIACSCTLWVRHHWKEVPTANMFSTQSYSSHQAKKTNIHSHALLRIHIASKINEDCSSFPASSSLQSSKQQNASVLDTSNVLTGNNNTPCHACRCTSLPLLQSFTNVSTTSHVPGCSLQL